MLWHWQNLNTDLIIYIPQNVITYSFGVNQLWLKSEELLLVFGVKDTGGLIPMPQNS